MIFFSLFKLVYTCNYADDTTIYSCGENLDTISQKLENDCSTALEWFTDNFMTVIQKNAIFWLLDSGVMFPLLLGLEILTL